MQVYCTISCLFNQNYCLKYIVKQSNFKTKHRSQIERIPSSTRCSKVFLQHRAHIWRTEKKLAMGSLLISKRCCKFLEAARALLMRWIGALGQEKKEKALLYHSSLITFCTPITVTNWAAIPSQLRTGCSLQWLQGDFLGWESDRKWEAASQHRYTKTAPQPQTLWLHAACFCRSKEKANI